MRHLAMLILQALCLYYPTKQFQTSNKRNKRKQHNSSENKVFFLFALSHLSVSISYFITVLRLINRCIVSFSVSNENLYLFLLFIVMCTNHTYNGVLCFNDSNKQLELNVLFRFASMYLSLSLFIRCATVLILAFQINFTLEMRSFAQHFVIDYSVRLCNSFPSRSNSQCSAWLVSTQLSCLRPYKSNNFTNQELCVLHYTLYCLFIYLCVV